MNTKKQTSLEEKIANAEAFDFSHIAEYHARKHNQTADEVAATIKELKRWLVLCVTNRDRNYSIFGEVDQLWHTFILFTEDYHEFCRRIGGFVHHVPESSKTSSNDENTEEKALSGYGRFLDDYAELISATPNETLLPSVSTLRHIAICSHSTGGCACGFDRPRK